MIGGGGNDDSGMMAEINVTPMVDVMLVLLIIFLVTAPLLVPQSLGIKLPETESVKSAEPVEKNRLVIHADERVEYNGESYEDQALKDTLKEAASDETFALVLEADQAVPYGRVAELLALAQNAGVRRLGFVTITPQSGR